MKKYGKPTGLATAATMLSWERGHLFALVENLAMTSAGYHRQLDEVVLHELRMSERGAPTKLLTKALQRIRRRFEKLCVTKRRRSQRAVERDLARFHGKAAIKELRTAVKARRWA